MRKYKQKAFTLIELMLVLAIIGLLASVILLALTQTRIKGRDSKRVQDVKNLIKGMELYFSENNTYPKYGTADTAYLLSTALTGAVPPLAPNYTASIPQDPLTGTAGVQPYQYIWGNGGKDYGINVYYELTGAYCKYRTSGGPATWFSSSPDCTK